MGVGFPRLAVGFTTQREPRTSNVQALLWGASWPAALPVTCELGGRGISDFELARTGELPESIQKMFIQSYPRLVIVLGIPSS